MYTHPDEIDNKKVLYLTKDLWESNKEKVIEVKQSELLEACNDDADKTVNEIDKE